MTWLVLRQHRAALGVFAVLFLGAAAGYLLFGRFGMDARTVYSDVSGFAQVIRYGEEFGRFLLVPLLIGMFVGAPLVSRELEHNTFRYAWTQGVSRSRWLAAKVLLAGGAILVCSTIFSGAHMMWFAPVAPDLGWFQIFNQGVPVFPASCLFAFALGVAAGTVVKQTVAAMALTLFGGAVVFIALSRFRMSYMTPVELTVPSNGTFSTELPENAKDGFLLSFGGSIDENVFTFHPADRFWPFQFIEAGIYVVLIAGCLATSFWWLRRKLS
ncbi:ABC transporter permease subunit [Saccharopolyspora sp. NPDC050389]|uniref:ABC transporter permease subunit n=1 Tax=Saccharopolyspora sp. NPDC050389 TaxID=3155516 RepID=UPI0033D3A46A